MKAGWTSDNLNIRQINNEMEYGAAMYQKRFTTSRSLETITEWNKQIISLRN